MISTCARSDLLWAYSVRMQLLRDHPSRSKVRMLEQPRVRVQYYSTYIAWTIFDFIFLFFYFYVFYVFFPPFRRRIEKQKNMGGTKNRVRVFALEHKQNAGRGTFFFFFFFDDLWRFAEVSQKKKIRGIKNWGVAAKSWKLCVQWTAERGFYRLVDGIFNANCKTKSIYEKHLPWP